MGVPGGELLATTRVRRARVLPRVSIAICSGSLRSTTRSDCRSASTWAEISRAMRGKVLAEAVLMGRYGR